MTVTAGLHVYEGGEEHELVQAVYENRKAQVRYEFNPSGEVGVDKVKLFAAALMSAVEEHGKDGRLTAMACSEIEIASMLGVKSVTA